MQTFIRALLLAALALGAGCYADTTRSFDPHTLDSTPGWTAVRNVSLVAQKQEMDCGAAAVAMILAFWSHPIAEDVIWSQGSPEAGHGLTAGWLRDYLRKQGLTAYLIHGTYADLASELALGHPILVGVIKVAGKTGLSHYEVVVALNPSTHTVVLLDPARLDWRQSTVDDFMKEWRLSGYAMIAAHAPDQATQPASLPASLPAPQ